jgi:gamma-glutamyltranspeptidase/glutathione hydrolase
VIGLPAYCWPMLPLLPMRPVAGDDERMNAAVWRQHAATVFTCEKQPATARLGMVVANHPLAAAAGVEMLAGGGNAVDAAIAALFTLSVVEPMMVGPLGGGMAHLRLPDGRHVVLDGLSTAPRAATPDLYRLAPDAADPQETVGRQNVIGPLAMGVPGALAGWCAALARYGTLSLDDVLQPAIRHAGRGFVVTPYLADCIGDARADLARDPDLARLLLADGAPLPPGTRLVRGDYTESLRLIAREGAAALYGGALGTALTAHMRDAGGLIDAGDLAAYAPIERAPIIGAYRGHQVLGPPPPSSAGVHIAQMLAILEGFPIAADGFGALANLHRLAEVLKIAFADRAVATADPAFVAVPVAELTDPAYAARRRAAIDPAQAQTWGPGVAAAESAHTTHVTVADRHGGIVATTQTINSLFGARFSIPGTGLIANNYMYNFDPRPGRALSIAPGKRVFTSMAPMIATRDGRPVFALGLPGGLRIFGSAMQAIVNLIDHGMSAQEAVEAPRLWTQGGRLELEDGFPQRTLRGLAGMGHDAAFVAQVGGGTNAICFAPDGTLTGAACWRADGTPIGLGGGLARAGVRFRA